MTRMTDEELDVLSRCFPTHMGEPTAAVLVQRCISELKERRALDLTSEEREALEWARVCVVQDMQYPLERHQRALAILSRLVKQEGES